ncbi:MAG: phosphatidylserine decarboxylase [Treponema sp.]|nr:phosphatidylserine decarboxylase [Treponema sp.]
MRITENYVTKEIKYKDKSAANFLYNSLPGRILLKLLVKNTVSRFAGVLMKSSASKRFITRFIKQNNIDMDEYENVNYKSFNDFFIRKIKNGNRPFSDNINDIIAPCDGKLTIYPITPDGSFIVKNSIFTIESLLMDKNLADEFKDGICLIFRLTPDDYHRYIYIDDGEIISAKKIKGVLHTVRPIAFDKYKVYKQNTREYTVQQTKNLGKVIQMEVGALFVGRISNHIKGHTFKRGDEKGMFEFGGSTIVLMFQKNTVELNKSIYENTLLKKETIVKMGNKIGEKIFNIR